MHLAAMKWLTLQLPKWWIRMERPFREAELGVTSPQVAIPLDAPETGEILLMEPAELQILTLPSGANWASQFRTLNIASIGPIATAAPLVTLVRHPNLQTLFAEG